VGTTVAPWQLFLQQSNVVDKRITPRWIRYERADLWIGVAVVMAGAIALMAVAAFGFAGTDLAGQFTDASGVAAGLRAQPATPSARCSRSSCWTLIGANARLGLATTYTVT
jgi:Mn2+/Fe2+ NRAMP family transporter